MDYDEDVPQAWKKYTVHLSDGTYDIYEYQRDTEQESNLARPPECTLNLQADESTLRCLKWILLNQKDVDHELKTAPVLENFEYASSDEDIWDALSDGKQEVKPREPVQINTTCEWQRCNAQFTDNNEFLDHIQKHLKDVPKHEGHEYLCEWDLCDFKCNSLSTFERHVLYHEMHGRFLSAGESLELMHKLPKCSLSGLDRNRLPELPSDFVCLWRECNVVFKSVSLLHDHIVQHCTDEYQEKKLISCQWRGCSYAAKRLSQLKTHIGRMHTQILVYACRKCGASRKSERTFFAHFLSQAPVKNPKLCCPHCNQLFLKDVHLKGHIKNQHRAITCDICSLKFMGDTQLKVHVANVHVKLRPFQCPDCPKSFPSKNNLRAHMHVHNKKEGGYQCTQCEYVGSSYLALRKHNYASHMGRNYPYECHLCGQQFQNVRQIGKHFKREHQLEVPEGFHRYTYRLEDGPVYRLKTMKSYDSTGEYGEKTKPKKWPSAAIPIKLDIQFKEDEEEEDDDDDETQVKLELVDDSVAVAPKVDERFTGFRRAKKIIDSRL